MAFDTSCVCLKVSIMQRHCYKGNVLLEAQGELAGIRRYIIKGNSQP